MTSAVSNISAYGLSGLSSTQVSARIADARERVAYIEAQTWEGTTTASLAAKISPGVAWALNELQTADDVLSTKSIKALLPGTIFAASALNEFRLHANDPTYIPATTGEASVKAAAVLLNLPAILRGYDL